MLITLSRPGTFGGIRSTSRASRRLLAPRLWIAQTLAVFLRGRLRAVPVPILRPPLIGGPVRCTPFFSSSRGRLTPSPIPHKPIQPGLEKLLAVRPVETKKRGPDVNDLHSFPILNEPSPGSERSNNTNGGSSLGVCSSLTPATSPQQSQPSLHTGRSGSNDSSAFRSC